MFKLSSSPLKIAFSLSILVVCALSKKKNEKKVMEQFQAFHGKKIDVIIKRNTMIRVAAPPLFYLFEHGNLTSKMLLY